MANGITDLGNSIGYLYTVDPDGTSILNSERNTPIAARSFKLLAVQAAANTLNKRAYGVIIISNPTGAGNITNVNISGVNQIGSNVAYVAGAAETVAINLAAAINSFTPGSGYNYIATAIGFRVYVYAPIDAGSIPNGEVITVSDTGNISITTNDINYGSDNTDVFDSQIGFRFFINADYNGTAVSGSLTNAVEISDQIIPRGLNLSFDRQSLTIVNGIINFNRNSSITIIDVSTQGGAPTDDLDSITIGQGAEGDIVILRGASSSNVVTITSSGNINKINAFSTADKETQIILMFLDGEWWEASRSGGNYVPTVSSFRTASFPFSGQNGRTSSAPADNTTLTLTANSSDTNRRISGSATLTTGNYTITLSATGAVEGDYFLISYYGTVTVGAFDVIIGGVTLSDREALLGGVMLLFVYDSGLGAFALVSKSYDLSTYTLDSTNIGSATIAVSDLSTSLTYEVINLPVSFESGEACNNRFKMPYAGTVSEVYGVVTKALANTDAGTVQLKNAAGTNMTAGLLTFALSSALETAVTVTPTADNTFAAGDILYATSAKTTAGGKVLLSIKVTRS